MQKSLARTIGEGTFWLTAGTLMIKAVSLLTIFLILHYLTVTQYGLTELVVSVIPIFGIFILPGMRDVIVADMGVEKGKGELGNAKSIFLGFFKLQLLLAIIAWLLVFFGSNLIAQFYQGPISGLLKIASFTFLIAPFRASIITIFDVTLDYLHQSLYTFIEEAAKCLLIVILLIFFHSGTVGVVTAGVLAEFCAVFINAPAFVRNYRPFKLAVIEHVQPFWQILRMHRKWNLFSTYLNNFGQNIRIWIIERMLGTEAVGFFAVAWGLLSHTSGLFPLNDVMAPLLPQYLHQREKFRRLINKAIKYQILGFAALGVVAAIIFPPIIMWIFPKYASSMPIFRILLLSLVPLAVSGVLTTIFSAVKAQKDLFYANALSTLAIIIVTPLLIIPLGLAGVAYASAIATLVFVIERWRGLKALLPDLKIIPSTFYSLDEEDRLYIQKARQFFRNCLRLKDKANG